jgi:DNA-binding MarR family transcriptional regulator
VTNAPRGDKDANTIWALDTSVCQINIHVTSATVAGMPVATAPTEGANAERSSVDLRLASLAVELMDRTKQHVREVAEERGLSVAQVDVLRRLRRGPSPMRRLADQMNCEPSNLTGLVDRLEARGLVERQPYPDDRRVKCLALTESGDRLSMELWIAVADRCDLNHLADASKEKLGSLLRQALRGQNAPDPGGLTQGA